MFGTRLGRIYWFVMAVLTVWLWSGVVLGAYSVSTGLILSSVVVATFTFDYLTAHWRRLEDEHL